MSLGDLWTGAALVLFASLAGAMDTQKSVEALAAFDRGEAALSASVRLTLVEEIGAKSLGLAETGVRAQALATRAVVDPDAGVREASLAALGNLEGAEAPTALAQLAGDLPTAEAVRAAEALGKSTDGASYVLNLLEVGLLEKETQSTDRGQTWQSRSETGSLAPAVLVALLAYMDRAIDGATVDSACQILLLAKVHRDPTVRNAANGALDAAIGRLGARGSDAEVVVLLDSLGGAVWDKSELLVRRSIYLIGRGVRLEEALQGARLVQSRTKGFAGYESRRWRFFGCYLEAAALLALGRAGETNDSLMRASFVLDGLGMERMDLLPDLLVPSVISAARAAEVLSLRGLVELMAATCLLAEGQSPSASRVLGHLRMAHEYSLWSQLREAAVDTNASISGFDGVLDSELGPRRLVLSAPENPHWSGAKRNQGLDLLLNLGAASRVVVGDELPGFRPPANAPSDRLIESDPQRFQLLKGIRPAQLQAVRRAHPSPTAAGEVPVVQMERRGLTAAIVRDEEQQWKELDGLRLPSIFALLLAGDLRAEDRSDDAALLCDQLLQDLEAGGSLEQGAWGAWLGARVQIALGGSLSDAGRPREAVDVLEEAVLGLEAVENTLLERKSAEMDPRMLPMHDAQIEQTRGLRSEALVGLAVTCNVRLGDPETALGYFERAYEIQQTDFMKGLLACYRARFGAEQEARGLLRTLEPDRPVFYNMACAYALLGDTTEALALLERELNENHFTPGSLARQKRWAKGDPDLANLWDDARFLKLVGE
ncbi:MAG: hypothetical protein ACI8Q9_001083 [Planctomycetota bacterium]|jgi:hypothetical protein